MKRLIFKCWPSIDEICSVRVKNDCRKLGIGTTEMERLLHLAENPDKNFLKIFGRKSLDEIEAIRKRIKKLQLVPPNRN